MAGVYVCMVAEEMRRRNPAGKGFVNGRNNQAQNSCLSQSEGCILDVKILPYGADCQQHKRNNNRQDHAEHDRRKEKGAQEGRSGKEKIVPIKIGGYADVGEGYCQDMPQQFIALETSGDIRGQLVEESRHRTRALSVVPKQYLFSLYLLSVPLVGSSGSLVDGQSGFVYPTNLPLSSQNFQKQHIISHFP